MLNEEQAIYDKLLAYPLASWDIVVTPGHPMGGDPMTTLRTINPSGSLVEVTLRIGSQSHSDSNGRDVWSTYERHTVTVDGTYLQISEQFAGLLFFSLKRRVESDPAYLAKLAKEARAQEEAKVRERQSLFDKL